jgi:hypothetical protein
VLPADVVSALYDETARLEARRLPSMPATRHVEALPFLSQAVQGHLPSHLIFDALHEEHARVMRCLSSGRVLGLGMSSYWERGRAPVSAIASKEAVLLLLHRERLLRLTEHELSR